MSELERVKKEVIAAIGHELSLEVLRDYFDNLTAKLHNANRFVLQELSHSNIQRPALGQLEHFAIQQVTSDVFDNTDIAYNLKETNAKGAFYPLIELSGIALLPRRSVKREEWKKAKYMNELAQNNQKEKFDYKPMDLFTPSNPVFLESQSNNITDKILVIVDILFLETLHVKLIVPSSNLNHIHLTIPLEDLISGIETASDDKNVEINPVSRLKKSLSDLDRKIENE